MYKETTINKIKRGDRIRIFRNSHPTIQGVVDGIKYQNSLHYSPLLFIRIDVSDSEMPITIQHRYSGNETFQTYTQEPEVSHDELLRQAISHLKMRSVADRKYAIKALLDTLN